MSALDTLGKRIKHYRIKKGLTQKQLADLIGVKHNSVCDWEHDRNKPCVDVIELLMGALDVNANTLWGWDTPEQIKKDARELAEKVLADEKMKELVVLLSELPDSDVDMVANFVKRLK